MATRIEFHKHGGPEVLQAVEFTPADPAENEIGSKIKPLALILSTRISAAAFTRRHRYPAD